MITKIDELFRLLDDLGNHTSIKLTMQRDEEIMYCFVEKHGETYKLTFKDCFDNIIFNFEGLTKRQLSERITINPLPNKH